MATFLLIIGMCIPIQGHSSLEEKLYRDFALRVRPYESFKVPMPSNGDLSFKYEFKLADPLWEVPKMFDFSLDPDNKKYYRHFWDKFFLQDGSYLEVGNEKVPITCIFVNGQDNRFSKDSPLIPDFLIKVYVVANDFTCVGPINPGWPGNGGIKESWETYVYFEVRDPTIMLPTQIHIRYRRAEFPAFVIDGGRQ
jgi:hypothetical protein